MVRVLVASLALAAAVGATRAEAPKVSLALKGLDPVELVAGKEVAGKEDVAATRGRYRYQFATPANKAAFEKNPGQFAVQFGGACARMGPLSGHGSPDRFHVFDGRIFLFASESCRNGFKAAPELHVDKEDAAPRGTAAEVKRGKELVELALTGFGGAKAVDAVAALRVESTLSSTPRRTRLRS